MSEHAEDFGAAEERQVDWQRVWKRVVLIGVLVFVAVVLVVGSQNYEERARVRFLLWSRETRLLTIFLASIGLGVILAEAVRRFRSVRRRQQALDAAAAAGAGVGRAAPTVSAAAGPSAAGPRHRA